jgi:hypothetical protein
MINNYVFMIDSVSEWSVSTFRPFVNWQICKRTLTIAMATAGKLRGTEADLQLPEEA